MHATPPSVLLKAQQSDLGRQLVAQTAELHVLAQLAEQLAALEDQGPVSAWCEGLLTSLLGRLTEKHIEIQATQAALTQLASSERQS